MLNLDGPEKPSKIAGFAIIEASKPGTRSPENRKRYGRPRFYSDARFYSTAGTSRIRRRSSISTRKSAWGRTWDSCR